MPEQPKAKTMKLEPDCNLKIRRLPIIYSFLEIANRHKKMNPLLREWISTIKLITNCESAGIRLLDNNGNISYQSHDGFSQEFYDLESPLSIKSDECICINVIKGTTDPNLPYYTKDGSFYTNSTTRLLVTVPKEELGQTRDICNQFGYESVVLVPIRLRGKILGLIHIADHKKGMVTLKKVELLEAIALELGATIHRVWADENLYESQERYRALLEAGTQIGEAVVILQDTSQKEGTHTFVSEMWPLITGYSTKELLSMSFFDLVHPAYKQASIDRHRQKISDKSMPGLFELVIISKDGAEVPIELTSACTMFKGQRANVDFIRDISSRKSMEESLKRSNERYRSLFDNCPISLWEEDWSEVKRFVDSLPARGIKDLRIYFANNPDAAVQCACKVKVLDVNKASLDLFEATTKEDLYAGLNGIFGQESYQSFAEAIVLSAEGHAIVEGDYISKERAPSNHTLVKGPSFL